MDIDNLFADMRGRLQGLESSQKMTLRELDQVRKSIKKGHEATVGLAGTLAGIEQVLRDHERRIQALEQRSSPAA